MILPFVVLRRLDCVLEPPKDQVIDTYIWIVTIRKSERRKDKVQLINAVDFYQKMRKSLGNKRNYITDGQIAEITKIYTDFTDGEHCKIFDNADFGYTKARWSVLCARGPIRRLNSCICLSSPTAKASPNPTPNCVVMKKSRLPQTHRLELLYRQRNQAQGELFEGNGNMVLGECQ